MNPPIKLNYERRFIGEVVDIPLHQQVWNWLRGKGWHASKYVFVEVLPDSPG